MSRNLPEAPRWRPRTDYTIEALQWLGQYEELPADWRNSGMVELNDAGNRLLVRTPDGIATPRTGDYLCRGVSGEYTVVRRATFERMFERTTQ